MVKKFKETNELIQILKQKNISIKDGEQAKNYLREDICNIIKASELIKCNKDISEFILNNYPKFHVYVSEKR